MRRLGLLPLLLLAAFFAPGASDTAVAATCSDYDTQAQAQHAADTRDADGDGVYLRGSPVALQPAGQRRWRRSGWWRSSTAAQARAGDPGADHACRGRRHRAG